MANTTKGVHTVANPNGRGWMNEANGVPLSTHKTKAKAIRTGRAMAKKHGEQYTEHRADGSIVESRTYAVTPL